jgi:hypothetical protein
MRRCIKMSEERVPFIQIKNMHLIDSRTLARKAEVNTVVISKMLAGDPVKKWQAEEVLNALSEMTNRMYTLMHKQVTFLGMSHTGEASPSEQNNRLIKLE